MNTPLALKLRPKTIDDVIGQKHLVGENAPIRNFINNKRISIIYLQIIDIFYQNEYYLAIFFIS